MKSTCVKSGGVFLIVVLASLFFIQCDSGAKKKAEQEEREKAELLEESVSFMRNLVSGINKMCPMKVDEITRLDSVAFYPGMVYQTFYTITDKSKFDLNHFENVLVSESKENIKNNPQMGDFRKYGVTIRSYYSDKSGNFLYKFDILPEDYK